MTLVANNISFLPIKNSTKLHYIRISELNQLFRGLFATAVHKNKLIFIEQLDNIFISYGFAGNIYSVRNMTCDKLIGAMYIEDDISTLIFHQSNCLVHNYLVVCIRFITCPGTSESIRLDKNTGISFL